MDNVPEHFEGILVSHFEGITFELEIVGAENEALWDDNGEEYQGHTTVYTYEIRGTFLKSECKSSFRDINMLPTMINILIQDLKNKEESHYDRVKRWIEVTHSEEE